MSGLGTSQAGAFARINSRRNGRLSSPAHVAGAKTTWDVMPHVPSNNDIPQDAPDCVQDYHDDDYVGAGVKSAKR
jgi:hypothetical protein